jgi:hypothetical protein
LNYKYVNKRFQETCNHCGKIGHKGEDCWAKNENKDKRPNNYRSGKSEKGFIVSNNLETSDNEFNLMGITRSTNGKHIPNDPNIFIADTGATSDSSPSLIGFKNIHKATEEDNIMDASGNSVIGEKIGDLSGMACDLYSICL